jgi:hypothetical protein
VLREADHVLVVADPTQETRLKLTLKGSTRADPSSQVAITLVPTQMVRHSRANLMSPSLTARQLSQKAASGSWERTSMPR